MRSPNQHGKAEVYCRNLTAEFFQEVEIRLPTVIEPNRCTGYEVFWCCLKPADAYAEIVRWNRPIGDCTTLERLAGADFGVKHGDVVEATIEGNVLRNFVNGVEIMSLTDDVYTAGNPGIGFNFGVGDTKPTTASPRSSSTPTMTEPRRRAGAAMVHASGMLV